jgi:hypothetical protein
MGHEGFGLRRGIHLIAQHLPTKSSSQFSMFVIICEIIQIRAKIQISSSYKVSRGMHDLVVPICYVATESKSIYQNTPLGLKSQRPLSSFLLPNKDVANRGS